MGSYAGKAYVKVIRDVQEVDLGTDKHGAVLTRPGQVRTTLEVRFEGSRDVLTFDVAGMTP